MCRACGARNFLREFSQAFRPGLTYAAPTALVWRHRAGRKLALRGAVGRLGTKKEHSQEWLCHEQRGAQGGLPEPPFEPVTGGFSG